LPSRDKKILETNDKNMKKKVEQLFELAKELKEQVENTDSTEVLSLNVLKKAEENREARARHPQPFQGLVRLSNYARRAVAGNRALQTAH
jgi:hypothetical protein